MGAIAVPQATRTRCGRRLGRRDGTRRYLIECVRQECNIIKERIFAATALEAANPGTCVATYGDPFDPKMFEPKPPPLNINRYGMYAQVATSDTPVVSFLASMVLSIPATAISNERLQSASAMLTRKLRASTSPETTQVVE